MLYENFTNLSMCFAFELDGVVNEPEEVNDFWIIIALVLLLLASVITLWCSI